MDNLSVIEVFILEVSKRAASYHMFYTHAVNVLHLHFILLHLLFTGDAAAGCDHHAGVGGKIKQDTARVWSIEEQLTRMKRCQN